MGGTYLQSIARWVLGIKSLTTSYKTKDPLLTFLGCFLYGCQAIRLDSLHGIGSCHVEPRLERRNVTDNLVDDFVFHFVDGLARFIVAFKQFDLRPDQCQRVLHQISYGDGENIRFGIERLRLLVPEVSLNVGMARQKKAYNLQATLTDEPTD